MNDNEQLDSVADAQYEPFVSYTWKKRWIVVLLLVYSVILGIIYGFLFEEDSPLETIANLPLLILGIAWCFTDAAERNQRIGTLERLLLVLLFLFAFPIYLFRTRGIGGAIKTLAFATVLVGVMLACQIVTAMATLHIGDIAGYWKVAY